MISMPPGMIPDPIIRDTHSPASSDDGKPMSIARAVSGFFSIRTVTSVTTPRRPSEPLIRPGRTEAGGLGVFPAEAKDFTGHEHDFTTEHVVGGHAVFQAMHAAGIFRHVTADCARNLRGRIRRVIKSRVCNRIAD